VHSTLHVIRILRSRKMRRMSVLCTFGIILPLFAGPQITVCGEPMLAEAQQAYVDGSYQAAIEKARACVAYQPDRAWRIVGAGACFLKDRASAVDAFNHLANTDRQFLRYVCTRNGIKLD